MKHQGVLRLVYQGEDTPDCGVACLASYLGITYERAIAAVLKVNPHVLNTGVSTDNLIRASQKLSNKRNPRKLTAIGYEEGSTTVGILEVIGDNHFVIYHGGTIIDLRDRTVWEPDVFFDHYRARPGKLLTVL